MGIINTDEKREAKNILEMLLGGDAGIVKLPTKQYEVKRFSEMYGSPFIVTLKAVSAERWEEFQDMAVKINGKDVNIDTNLLQVLVVMENVYADKETKTQLFKSKALMEKFGVPTPKELVKKILLSGEIINIYTQISELSGFGEDAVKEVKNSLKQTDLPA